jgi:site-specific DNA-methyltransferase (adenine-specific)
VHPTFEEFGWEYRNCHVWNKGLGHVAGNANTVTLRKFPVVTEVCVQYVKAARFAVGSTMLSMRDWLRHEWLRSGLPMYLANKACGVANAATRKYLTADHLWYYPPPEAFEAMVQFVNQRGKPEGRPYFSTDGKQPLTGTEWSKLRSKFTCLFGVNNVWTEPPVRGAERLKKRGFECLHSNQKPLKLLDLLLRASTDPGDMVWEPFGGLCSVAVAAHKLGRRCVSAEIDPDFFVAAGSRLAASNGGG